MTSAMRVMRRILLLPVSGAEQREREIVALSAQLHRGKIEVSHAVGKMRTRAEELRAAYDELLGKLE